MRPNVDEETALSKRSTPFFMECNLAIMRGMMDCFWAAGGSACSMVSIAMTEVSETISSADFAEINNKIKQVKEKSIVNSS